MLLLFFLIQFLIYLICQLDKSFLYKQKQLSSLLKLLDGLCHDEGKTILMVSHDLAAIRQTAHRMIFLEESIRFDGTTEEFPDLVELADLRGIGNVHDEPNSKEVE